MPNSDSANCADEIVECALDCARGYRLESAFQPIFGLSHRRAVGFEGLIRARTQANVPVSPLALFQAAQALSEAQPLDRLCQQLHIQNFAVRAPANRWLFLNLDTKTLTSKSYRDGFLAGQMATANLPFHQLVVEITEGGIHDENVLMDAVAHFRALGALVALDDFGTGHSNFDRLWRLAPDIVKLDRSIILQASAHGAGKLRRMLPNLVAMMHEAGIMVLAEGVETQDQGLMALDADIDLVQGFYFGRPAAEIDHSEGTLPALVALNEAFVDTAIDEDRRGRRTLAPYIDIFRAVAEAIDNGEDFERTCQSLIAMPRTARCYLLDARGKELMYVTASERQYKPDIRCAPIADTDGCAWFHRPYFRAALNDRRRVKISRPFLSATDMHMCVTLSIANGIDDCRVFCCDILW